MIRRVALKQLLVFFALAAPCLAQKPAPASFAVSGLPASTSVVPYSAQFPIPQVFSVTATRNNAPATGILFTISSSGAALGFSPTQQGCNSPVTSISGITGSANLFACLDTHKFVRGTYVFVLTVRSASRTPATAGAPSEMGEFARPESSATAADCVAQTGTIPETRVTVVVTVAGTGEIKTNVSTLTLNSDKLRDTVRISYVSNNTVFGPSSPASSGGINSIAMDPAVPDEGSWMSLSSDCQGVSLAGAASCTITVVANPFRLVGAAAGTAYTARLSIASDTGTKSDVVITFNYTRAVVSQLFPHLVDQNEWQTDLKLINPSACLVSGTLVFHLDGGIPSVKIAGQGAVSSIPFEIPAGGSVTYRTVGFSKDPEFVQGWVEIVAPVQLSGQAVFRRQLANGKPYEASVPVTTPVPSFSLTYDSTQYDTSSPDRFITALAIVNPDSQPNRTIVAKVSCSFINSNSATPGVAVPLPSVLTLAAFEHLGVLPAFVGRGVATCTTGNPDQYVAVLGLNFLGVSGFSAIPTVE